MVSHYFSDIDVQVSKSFHYGLKVFRSQIPSLAGFSIVNFPSPSVKSDSVYIYLVEKSIQAWSKYKWFEDTAITIHRTTRKVFTAFRAIHRQGAHETYYEHVLELEQHLILRPTSLKFEIVGSNFARIQGDADYNVTYKVGETTAPPSTDFGTIQINGDDAHRIFVAALQIISRFQDLNSTFETYDETDDYSDDEEHIVIMIRHSGDKGLRVKLPILRDECNNFVIREAERNTHTVSYQAVWFDDLLRATVSDNEAFQSWKDVVEAIASRVREDLQRQGHLVALETELATLTFPFCVLSDEDVPANL